MSFVARKKGKQIFGPEDEILVLIAPPSSNGSGKFARMRKLARACAAYSGAIYENSDQIFSLQNYFKEQIYSLQYILLLCHWYHWSGVVLDCIDS